MEVSWLAGLAEEGPPIGLMSPRLGQCTRDEFEARYKLQVPGGDLKLDAVRSYVQQINTRAQASKEYWEGPFVQELLQTALRHRNLQGERACNSRIIRADNVMSAPIFVLTLPKHDEGHQS